MRYDFSSNAYICKVFLNNFSNFRSIWHIRTWNRHCPKFHFKSVFKSSCFQKFFCFFRIVLISFNIIVISRNRWRHWVFRDICTTFEERINDCLFINCIVHCLTYFFFIERRTSRCKTKVAYVHGRTFKQL